MSDHALTVAELIAVLQEAVELDPANAAKFVLTTSETGCVHEYVSGIDRIEDDTVVLGEYDRRNS